MIDIIKSLTGKQKFVAALIAKLLSSVSSVMTVALKTSDCKEISDQYKSLVTNQGELMKINNQLMADYNQARRDFSTIQDYLDSVERINRTSSTVASVKVTEDRSTVRTEPRNDYAESDSMMVAASPMEEPRKKTVTVNKTTVIKETPQTTKNILGSIKTITQKYVKN